jgi:hypothetical protein
MRPMQGVAGWNGPPRVDHVAVRPSRLSRLASLAAACTLSVALLVMLSPADVRTTQPPFAAGVQRIVMLQLPPQEPSPLTAITPSARDASRKPLSRRTAAMPAAAATAKPAEAPLADATESITPPEPPASAPLHLDRSVMRQAVGDSKSAVQQLADASGQALDTQRATASEALAAGVQRAVKPDCLAPGSSLLDLPVRIYQAATARCKVD